MWLSNGGTKSVLHSDSNHHLNCLIRGIKDFILISGNAPDQVRTILLFVTKQFISTNPTQAFFMYSNKSLLLMLLAHILTSMLIGEL